MIYNHGNSCCGKLTSTRIFFMSTSMKLLKIFPLSVGWDHLWQLPQNWCRGKSDGNDAMQNAWYRNQWPFRLSQVGSSCNQTKCFLPPAEPGFSGKGIWQQRLAESAFAQVVLCCFRDFCKGENLVVWTQGNAGICSCCSSWLPSGIHRLGSCLNLQFSEA